MNKIAGRFHFVGYVIGIVVLCAVVCWLISRVHLVFNLMAISILVSYLIAPAVTALHERGVGKILSITFVYVILAVIVGFFVAYLLPVVTHEFHRLVGNMGTMARNLEGIVVSGVSSAQTIAPESLKPMLSPENFQVSQLLQNSQAEFPSLVGGMMPSFFLGMKSAVGVLAGVFLVPLLTFYILMDVDTYKRSFLSILPKAWRQNATELLHRVDYTLGQYIRGQIIVCVSIGIFVGTALWALGIDYAVLIGFFAGVVDIIPYVGVVIGLIPAFLIALVNKGVLFAIFTIAVLESIHWLEGHVVVPAVVGHSVGLPPLTIMVALLAGAQIGGIMGMFVAVPFAAIIRVCIEFYVEKHSEFGALTEEDLLLPEKLTINGYDVVIPEHRRRVSQEKKLLFGGYPNARVEVVLHQEHGGSDDVGATGESDSSVVEAK